MGFRPSRAGNGGPGHVVRQPRILDESRSESGLFELIHFPTEGGNCLWFCLEVVLFVNLSGSNLKLVVVVVASTRWNPPNFTLRACGM